MVRFQAFLFGCVVCLFVAVGVARADIIDVDSAISRVTIYPDTARISRTVHVTLKDGAHSLRLKDIKSMLDENSFSVAGEGTATVKILGAGFKVEYLAEASDERVRDLESKLQSIDDALMDQNGALAILETKKQFLASVKLFSGQQIPKDLVTKMPAPAELEGVMQFLDTQSQGVEGSSRKNIIAIRELQKNRQALQQEMDQLRNSGQKEERSILVDIECVKAGDLTLDVSYTVPQVSWYPLYDARVSFEKNQAVLSSFAIVRQTTGEDWKDVQLVISTSRPSVGGRMPELSSWHLAPFVQRRYRESADAFGGMMKKTKAVMLASMVDSVEMESLPEAPQEATMVYAQSQSTGAALVYKVAKPVTIKSDGSDSRVPLSAQTLAVKFEYAATPKLSPYAYLKSVVTNSKEEQLLAGRINIFLDDNYVGFSDLSKTIAPEEAFDLYLGVDESVVVKRELLEQKSDDTLIGQIPSMTKKISYKYKVTTENYKPRDILVNLFDQIPVAQDDKIKIQKPQFSLKPIAESYKDRAGVLLWTLNLKTKEKQDITYSFTVEYPRDMAVEGL